MFTILKCPHFNKNCPQIPQVRRVIVYDDNDKPIEKQYSVYCACDRKIGWYNSRKEAKKSME